MTRTIATADLLEVLQRESERCREMLASADPEASVPHCPEWDVDDLLWHLARGQWGWASLVDQRVVDRADTDLPGPPRPRDHAELAALLGEASRRLVQAVANAPADAPVWGWTDRATVAWVIRRQAHEALVHRIDAEGVVGLASHVDPTVASDGVDEVLGNMHGWAATGARFTSGTPAVRIEAVDTGAAWSVQAGRRADDDLRDGPGRGRETVRVDHPEMPAATATVRGTARAVDLWLWNRHGPDGLAHDGDRAALATLEQIVERGL